MMSAVRGVAASRNRDNVGGAAGEVSSDFFYPTGALQAGDGKKDFSTHRCFFVNKTVAGLGWEKLIGHLSPAGRRGFLPPYPPGTAKGFPFVFHHSLPSGGASFWSWV